MYPRSQDHDKGLTFEYLPPSLRCAQRTSPGSALPSFALNRLALAQLLAICVRFSPIHGVSSLLMSNDSIDIKCHSQKAISSAPPTMAVDERCLKEDSKSWHRYVFWLWMTHGRGDGLFAQFCKNIGIQ